MGAYRNHAVGPAQSVTWLGLGIGLGIGIGLGLELGLGWLLSLQTHSPQRGQSRLVPGKGV